MSASLLWLGESRPCNLVYYLGLDAHLVVRGIAVRWGMGMYSTGEGGAGLRGVHSLGGEQDLERQALRAIIGP